MLATVMTRDDIHRPSPSKYLKWAQGLSLIHDHNEVDDRYLKSLCATADTLNYGRNALLKNKYVEIKENY